MNPRLLIAYAWRGCVIVAAGPAAMLAVVLITRLCAWSTGFEPIDKDGRPTEAMMLAAVFGWIAAFVGWVVVGYALFGGDGSADKAAMSDQRRAVGGYQPRPGPVDPKPPSGGSGVRGPLS